MAYDLDTFLAVPRASGLALSPDGTRAVTTVATVAPDGKKFRSALWELDPTGHAPARRITRSAAGDSGAMFTHDGALLFVSGRPNPDAAPDAEESSGALWCLPAAGGEAFMLLDPPGGVVAFAVARDTGRVVVAVGVVPGATTLDDDRELAGARKKAGVGAQLFDRYPIRFWDHYLGPRDLRYFVADPAGDGTFGDLRQVAVGDDEGDEGAFAISPDGTTLYLRVARRATPTDLTADLVAIDVKSGKHRSLTDGHFSFGQQAAVSPDGSMVACVRESIGSVDSPASDTIWLIDVASGAGRDITPALDRFPHSLTWAPDSKRLFFIADDGGHAPLFSVTVGKRPQVTRHTVDASYHSPQPHPDGRTVVALKSHIGYPPVATRVSIDDGETAPVEIPTPGSVKVPGRVRNLVAKGADGTPVRSWLVLPKGASRTKQAPLVVFVHGGPLGSWNDWTWRWNPWLLAERGYAVLLPDPAISTGYGLDFIRRGYGRWGDAPYTDVMAATDAACARPEIDESRTALMGGSFGGYMANWVAGHTDRFRCIVTHASLWALDQFHGTTDGGPWWEPEFGNPYLDPSRYIEWSPHRHIANIKTPMLVIHGELDHRVPIGEALRLWTDLRRHGVESKFLYFPDENHWILKPQNARVWYETVFAWLDHHVLGEDWQQPQLL
ncbi:MAG TPA: S9 family peptidase [Ilumatobacter sp.]|nr:S9 family peptidase [Ilumatobacter sp.]